MEKIPPQPNPPGFPVDFLGFRRFILRDGVRWIEYQAHPHHQTTLLLSRPCRPYRQPQNYRTSPPTLTGVGGSLCDAWRSLAESERTQTEVTLALSRGDRRVLQASSCSVSSSCLCCSDPAEEEEEEEGQLAGRESRGLDHVTEAQSLFASRSFGELAAAAAHPSLWSRHLSAGNTGGPTFSSKCIQLVITHVDGMQGAEISRLTTSEE